jgi:L-alanine-DL-glutamate epimerase-like enolase superfamily enzyme
MNLATSNFGVQEQPRKPGEILPDVFPVQPAWLDGHLLPSERPGLGIEIDEAAARKHPFQPAQFPQWRREDGSVTNW